MAKKREQLLILLCTENPQRQVVFFFFFFFGVLISFSKGQINKINYLQKETFISQTSFDNTKRLKTSLQSKVSLVLYVLIYSSGNPASPSFLLDNFERFLKVSYSVLQELSCLHDYCMYFSTFSFFFCSLHISVVAIPQVSTVLPIPTGDSTASTVSQIQMSGPRS